MGKKRLTLDMVKTAQFQPDHVQDQVSISKLYSNFPSRYVYNTSVKKSAVCAVSNEYGVQKCVWKTWFTYSNAFKPVHPSISYADVVKKNVSELHTQKMAPLEAVLGRSQQRKPPELDKNGDSTHKAHLEVGEQFRFVKNPVVNYPSSFAVPCFNRFDPLFDYDENLSDYDALLQVYNNVVDNVFSFAAQDTDESWSSHRLKLTNLTICWSRREWLMTLFDR